MRVEGGKIVPQIALSLVREIAVLRDQDASISGFYALNERFLAIDFEVRGNAFQLVTDLGEVLRVGEKGGVGAIMYYNM